MDSKITRPTMTNIDYKLKIPTDREGINQLHIFLYENRTKLSATGEEFFIIREVMILCKLLENKSKALTKPKSITLNIFQIKAIQYCYHWFATGNEITDLPQFVQLLSKINAKSNISNITIAA